MRMIFLHWGRRCLVAVLIVAAPAFSDPQMCWALFSRQQLFWPGLDSISQTRDSDSALRVGVLPVCAAHYAESIPCDSCHRLSQDGMEFFLGNALLHVISQALPGREVELIRPYSELMKSRHIEFPRILDSLDLPWRKWLAGCGDPLIYRPHEFMARPEDKRRLDRIASALGVTYVFVVRNFTADVGPKSPSLHLGSLRWSWNGALYNSASGHFEWAVGYSEDHTLMDLDDDLEPAFAKAWGAAIAKMPSDLNAWLRREPQ